MRVLNERAPVTHPTCASLGHPLFAFGAKRVKSFPKNNPLYRLRKRGSRSKSRGVSNRRHLFEIFFHHKHFKY